MRTAISVPVAVLTALVVLGTSLPALAESPRAFMAELKFGPWRPDVDKEFATKTPWSDAFGGGSFLMTQLEFDWEFFKKVGVLAVGGTIGYSQAKGHGRLSDKTKSTDTTSMHLMPLSLSLIYRFDYLERRFKFPFVPVVKGGVDAYFWWVTNGVGSVSKAADGTSGKGLTMGGHVTAGIMFLLDSLAPMMAQTLDQEIGVNNTYLFAEYTWNWIDDFGSNKSINLSSRNFLAGIAFEF
jgi:hypothetical protein